MLRQRETLLFRGWNLYMDKKLADSIYDMVKTKLNYEQGPFTHTKIEDCTRQISNLVFSCDEKETVDFVVA